MQFWLFLPQCLFCLILVLLRGWTARQGSAFMHVHWKHCWILTAAYFISTWMLYWQPRLHNTRIMWPVFERIWINSNFLVGLISLFTIMWVLLCVSNRWGCLKYLWFAQIMVWMFERQFVRSMQLRQCIYQMHQWINSTVNLNINKCTLSSFYLLIKCWLLTPSGIEISALICARV